MPSLFVNKALASILTAGIAFMGCGMMAGGLVRPGLLAAPAIRLPGAAPAPQGPQDAPAAPEPIAALLTAADAGAGEAVVKKQCVACHTFNAGGKAGVGPNLYGVVGGPHGHMAGFAYSAALKGKQGSWTFEDLDAWLTRPAAYAPGTRMAFAGLTAARQRADVIAYLRSLSPDPVALPAR